MKRAIVLVALAIGIFWTSAACTRVGPGYVGIKVDYAGDSRGVESIPTQTGYVGFTPFMSTVYEYPTFMQTARWTEGKNDGDSPSNEQMIFNSKEGMVIGADVSLSYQLDAAKVPAFYVKFRSDDLNAFTHNYLHNVARDAFNEVAPLYTVDELYGPKKEEFIQAVRKKVNEQVAPFGVNVQQFGFMGSMKLPNAVVTSLNAKIQATQDAIRIENEVRQTQAEAQKNIARAEGMSKAMITSAEGQAKANDIVAASIARNPQILEWERLKIQGKWDGKQPEMLVVSGNASPLIAVPGLSGNGK